MKRITLDDLQHLNACDKARKWFAATYPDGVDITAETLATAPDRRWIVWLASKLNPELGWTWAGIAFRYAAKQHPALAQYADNVTPENWKEAKDAATAAAYDAATAAAYAAAANAYAAATAAAYAADANAYAAAAAAYVNAWNEMSEIAIRSLLEAVNG